ncbi:MAG: MlaD family protein [Pseudoflavonifractor sp.]|nr:MlaD family protein [Pseudoflavonifractor sp.]
MKKKFSKEVLIGLSVLIAGLALFFGINYLKGINLFKAANYYYVSYTNVSGLAVSAPVTLNGYQVGLVREIEYEYDNPGHVKVELSLDRKLNIPAGTEAVIESDMLGTASIALKFTDNAKFHNVGDKLIGVVSSGLMDNVNNELMPNIVAVLPKVDSILTALNAVVADPALLQSVQRLSAITANLEKSTAQLAGMMNSTVPGVMTNVKELSVNLNTISSDLTELSGQLKDLPIDSTMQNVYDITQNVNDLTSRLQDNNSTLGLLMNDTQLYDNMNSAVSSLDSLLIDVKKNPKRYISIKLL